MVTENLWNILTLSCPSNVAGVWASNHSDPLWIHRFALAPSTSFVEKVRSRDPSIFQTCACTKVHWVGNSDWQYLFVFCHNRKKSETERQWRFFVKPTRWQVPEQKNDEETQTKDSRGSGKTWLYHHVSGWSGNEIWSIAAATNPPGMSNSFSMHPRVCYLCVQPLHWQIQHLCCELKH